MKKFIRIELTDDDRWIDEVKSIWNIPKGAKWNIHEDGKLIFEFFEEDED